MPTLQRVAPILPVRDVAKALEYYKRLGFKAEPYDEAGPHGPIYGFVSSGGVELHLALFRDLDANASTSACYVYVDNADALYAAWKSAAVDGRFNPPSDTPYGLREFVHWCFRSCRPRHPRCNTAPRAAVGANPRAAFGCAAVAQTWQSAHLSQGAKIADDDVRWIQRESLVAPAAVASKGR